jgi:hypothetical protein
VRPLAVIGCHSLGIHILILLPLMSFSAEMTVSPRARQAGAALAHRLPARAGDDRGLARPRPRRRDAARRRRGHAGVRHHAAGRARHVRPVLRRLRLLRARVYLPVFLRQQLRRLRPRRRGRLWLAGAGRPARLRPGQRGRRARRRLGQPLRLAQRRLQPGVPRPLADVRRLLRRRRGHDRRVPQRPRQRGLPQHLCRRRRRVRDGPDLRLPRAAAPGRGLHRRPPRQRPRVQGLLRRGELAHGLPPHGG